ncbi:hypothetical protein EN904_06410 [Mesorhizobium sp. M7A.F.Ca.CA.001.07.2.1]|uniref:hypothetical protein n=2 Tax=Phyllobacteriaceae TaxID=69277 RepID=UPI000FCC46E6|nr:MULTISPECIES: hypothetical protein [Mesorhizobium]RVB43341.1 hypothetical protein EN918_07615 [Mesorhizobium sp. M7A.F.Ca.CA.004.05.1.1]MCF6122207.1 hypothetical protein [Mesorhizobium ciceri]MCQ8812790.1 hypothetical protein [Mesorhizobium sp. SEMIA396]RUX80789.1 hypothetical protein EN983_07155 [Mesorhizobium sp. M7A.F.Ca.CA.004.08.2.1]RUX87044.1 hypothetical protein EN982_12385 [Mesorhizobium sp. M7A.F.Ca.CA.004.08.1.1]
MVLALWSMVAVTTFILVARHNRVSVVAIGYVGLLAYSVPALIGFTRPVSAKGLVPYLEPASSEAILVMVAAWLGFGLALLLMPSSVDGGRPPCYQLHPMRVTWFIRCALIISLACYAWMANRAGLEWYAMERADIYDAVGGLISIVWRWVSGIGLLASIYFDRLWGRGARIYQAIFALMVALNAIAGDRTVPVILAMAFAIVLLWEWPITKAALHWKAWAIGLATLAIIFFMKPFYLAYKRDLPFGRMLAGGSDPMAMVASWEAFGTHENIEGLIRSSTTYPWWNTVRDTLAQLLIQPSAFGFDSTGFNTVLQTQIFSQALYGLAGTFWGQAWAIGGIPVVIVFGLIYGGALVALHHASLKSKGMWFFFWIILGSVIGVYAHRNALENVLAQARQPFVGFVTIQVLVWVLLFGRFHTSVPAVPIVGRDYGK